MLQSVLWRQESIKLFTTLLDHNCVLIKWSEEDRKEGGKNERKEKMKPIQMKVKT